MFDLITGELKHAPRHQAPPRRRLRLRPRLPPRTSMRKVPWPGSKAESPEELQVESPPTSMSNPSAASTSSPAPRAPLRVGGAVKEPALVHRVDPVYPVLAVSAGLEGTVILEAIVDRDGRVESLRVLRSQGVLDRAALDAVKQWRYSPVLLNGQPEKFILTVVVSFKLEDT